MNPVATTTAGRVEGRAEAGVLAFLGVPYAGPRGTAGRFLPPVPAKAWAGTRPAQTPGPAAPQLTRALHGDHEMAEDCLVLNVWTPGTTGHRPVLFWMHGGGFFTGRGLTPHSDGAALALAEDVVVVSVNHRLAMLGFLHLAEHGGDKWGFEANPSVLDLIAALKWVSDNIAGFGGDPANVTLFGHSGGGGKVSAVLTSPLASGLFTRAVVHGGPPFGFKESARATTIADQALHMLGVRGDDLRGLQEIPLERIMQVQSELGVGAEPTDHGMLFAPVVGTASVPAYPEEALAAGVASDIPMMTGTSIDEARFIMATQPRWQDPAFDLNDATVLRIVESGIDAVADADALIEAYRRAGGSGGPRNIDVLMDLLSDQFTVRTARLAAAKAGGGEAPVYSYLCTLGHDTLLGSFHGTEMPVFFNNVGQGTIPAGGPAYDYAAPVLSHALATFARTGNPNDGDVGGLIWPCYTPADPLQFRFGDDGFEVTETYISERLRRWNGITASARQDPWGRAIGESGRA